MVLKLPVDFAKKIGEVLGLSEESVDEFFEIEEDKAGFFVARLKPKQFLDKAQFRTMCALARDLGGEGYIEGAKAWKIPGPFAKKPSEVPSGQGMGSETAYKAPRNAIPTTPSDQATDFLATHKAPGCALPAEPTDSSDLTQKTSTELKVKISDVLIGERFRKSVGSLSSLVQSIREVGLLHPIVVSEKNELIAGWRRIKAFELLGLAEIPCTRVNLANLREGEIQENIVRKDFTSSEHVAIKRVKQADMEAKHPVGRPKDNSSDSDEFTKGRTDDDIASFVGISRDTLRREEAIVKAAEQEPEKYGSLVAKMDNKEISVARAYSKVKIGKLSEKTMALKPPEGKFCTIVIDPPWPVEKIEREERPNQSKDLDYPTMSLVEIGELPIERLADEKGCHIYLWTTHKLLPEALKLFLKWNIKYQCLLTWVKPTGMTPFSWMYNTEHVLFGRIGNLPLLENGLKLSFEAPVIRHSEKPDMFYEKVRKASPEPRLEMFQRKQREGFKGWGNEVAGQ